MTNVDDRTGVKNEILNNNKRIVGTRRRQKHDKKNGYVAQKYKKKKIKTIYIKLLCISHTFIHQGIKKNLLNTRTLYKYKIWLEPCAIK